MAKEVTIIGKGLAAYVSIGLLEETGRRYHHIRFIEGALVGGTEPSEQISKVLQSSVDIVEGFRYDLLADYVARTQSALQWQGERAQAIAAIKDEAENKMVQQVDRAIKRWERDNPRPGQDLDTQPRPEPEPEPEPEPVPAGVDLGLVAVAVDDEFIDDDDTEEPPPGTGTETGTDGPWQKGDLVAVKQTGQRGIVMMAEEGDYHVSFPIPDSNPPRSEYPQKFDGSELEGVGR
jgi:hypothetical protein